MQVGLCIDCANMIQPPVGMDQSFERQFPWSGLWFTSFYQFRPSTGHVVQFSSSLFGVGASIGVYRYK